MKLIFRAMLICFVALCLTLSLKMIPSCASEQDEKYISSLLEAIKYRPESTHLQGLIEDFFKEKGIEIEISEDPAEGLTLISGYGLVLDQDIPVLQQIIQDHAGKMQINGQIETSEFPLFEITLGLAIHIPQDPTWIDQMREQRNRFHERVRAEFFSPGGSTPPSAGPNDPSTPRFFGIPGSVGSPPPPNDITLQ